MKEFFSTNILKWKFYVEDSTDPDYLNIRVGEYLKIYNKPTRDGWILVHRPRGDRKLGYMWRGLVPESFIERVG